MRLPCLLLLLLVLDEVGQHRLCAHARASAGYL